MQFLMMTTNDASAPAAPPTPELYAEMGKFIQEMSQAGVLLATGGLDPRATRIKHRDGKFTITDGPYTEAKEAIVGFALIQADSKEQAIEYSKRFWKIVGDGEGTIHQVFGPNDGPPTQ